MASIGATLPQLLQANVRRFGQSKPAIREKEYGIWQAYSWSQYLEQVRRFALGLAQRGFKRGDKLAIIGDNRPQLYWGLVAAQALGGVPVPIYQDAIAPEIQYVIDHCDATMVLAEDQEQVDKIIDIKDKLPRLACVIYDEPKGLRHYSAPYLCSFTAIQELGVDFAHRHPGFFEEALRAGAGEDIAIINYTSGTTGAPKGVMLSHRNIIATARNYLQVDRLSEGDDLMAYLPMAWIGDTFFSIALSFITGATVNCPEDASTVRQDFREIGPTMTFAPPRIWENLLSQAQVKLSDAGWLQRHLCQAWLPVGMKAAGLRLEGRPVPWWLDLLRGLGEWIVYAPLRDQLGLRHIRAATTGGAAIGPEVVQFFQGIGVNLKQLYGMTECAAPATVQRDGAVKLDSAGPPIPGVEIKISDRGEVLLQGPGLFAGYYKDPKATARAFQQGWLATGDAGFLDSDGHLVVIDRARDVSHLRDGALFAPQYIENRIKFSPYVKEAVAVGRAQPYVAAMLNIDLEVVGNWAEKHGVPYAGYADLAQKAEVYALVAGEVHRINARLNPSLHIQKFVILHKELDPDDAEITRTRKLRREVIYERYQDIIEAMYADGMAAVAVKAVVTYEDGRSAEIERTLKIYSVADGGV